MADYYPLIVRALASLPQKTAEHRQAVYDRARTALLRQLRGVDPPLPEGEIGRERQTLEEAIRRVEADFIAEHGGEPAGASSPERAAGPPQRPAPAPEAPPRSEPAPPDANGRAAVSPGTETRAPRRRAEAPPAEDRTADDAALDGPETGERGAPRRSAAVRSRQAASGARPVARPDNGKPRGKRSWQTLVLLTLVIAVVLGGLALLFINRASIFGEGPRTSSVPVVAADQPKTADRVTPATGDAARRPPPARPPSVAGTARAVLLEESPDGSAPQSFDGTVTWKTESVNAGPGLPPDIGIRADITIPERKIAVSFVLRRNTDQTLPASHTIEIGFKLPQDFAFGGVSNIPYVAAKPNLQAQGQPLVGLSVRVNPSLFLVGLSTVSQERQRNLVLMQAASAFDLPMVYTNNKKAKIAFEKGQTGVQAFTDAFTAWGELMQPPAEQQSGG